MLQHATVSAFRIHLLLPASGFELCVASASERGVRMAMSGGGKVTVKIFYWLSVTSFHRPHIGRERWKPLHSAATPLQGLIPPDRCQTQRISAFPAHT